MHTALRLLSSCLDGVFGWLARLAARVAALRFRLMINVVCVGGSHTHQIEKRSMKHYAGLDVSVKEASVCIVDETGKVCREVKVMSHPEELIRALKIRPGGSSASASKLVHFHNGCSPG